MKSTREFAMRILAVFTCAILSGLLVLPIGTPAAQKTEVWVAGTMAPSLYDPADLHHNVVEDDMFDGVTTTVKVPYLRTLGLVTFPYTTPYDESIAGGALNTVNAIKAIRAEDPTGTIVIAGLSQGSDVIMIAIRQLEDEGYDTSNIKPLVQGNPSSNVGGLKTSFAFGYVPGVGITLGGDTTPTKTPVIQMRKQYDIVADMPQYINALAIVNAGLGFMLGQHSYNGPLYGPTHVVTTSADGMITDVFVPYEGIVPVLKPFEMLGVPHALLEPINQPVKDLIELGYDRSFYGVPGAYPGKPIRMGLVPPPRLLVPGLKKFMEDSAIAVQKYAALVVPDRTPPVTSVPEVNDDPPTVANETVMNQRTVDTETSKDTQDASLEDDATPSVRRKTDVFADKPAFKFSEPKRLKLLRERLGRSPLFGDNENKPRRMQSTDDKPSDKESEDESGTDSSTSSSLSGSTESTSSPSNSSESASSSSNTSSSGSASSSNSSNSEGAAA